MERKTVYYSIAYDDIKRVIALLTRSSVKMRGKSAKNLGLGVKVAGNKSRKESRAPGAPGRSPTRRILSGPAASS